MQETRANTASIVESVRIMEQSSGNIYRLAVDGAENSSQIQERAGEMKRINTQSRNKTDEMYDVMKQKSETAIEEAKAVERINSP